MSTNKIQIVTVNNTLTIICDEEGFEEFKEVIKRGTLFGTQTSPEMKLFADTLLNRIEYTRTSKQLESLN